VSWLGTIMKILLVQPAPFEPGRLGLENIIWLSEPVALTSLAAVVPEHDVRILDMRLEADLAFNEALREFRPDLVGVTSMTTDCYQAKALLEIAKGTLGDRCLTLVGGHHPTLAPESFEDPCVDAMCIGEGEDTFRELVLHLEGRGSPRELGHIPGLRYRDSSGRWLTTDKRPQIRDLDSLPRPARHLIRKYAGEYFFTASGAMASMATSRGCSFDCNFCAIWEFYDRKTRFLSARAICDQLEEIDEKFVFFLDDNFLTNRRRLEELCDEIARRKIKKYWGTQGRTDFIAEHPDLMRRLRDAGLLMVLSGYESNDEDALAALLKRSSVEKNKRAAELLRELGILSTGIFMVRPDFGEDDFDRLYAHINELGVAIPLVTILTPLPGTALHRERRHELLTEDARLFDLLHAVLPTRLPRTLFYKKLAQHNSTTWPSFQRGVSAVFRQRPEAFLEALPGIVRFLRNASNHRPIIEDHRSHLRDELGIIDARVASQAPKPPTPSPTMAQVRHRLNVIR
jgi:radical SAM superfamily enzyme YgiQ (UPF0313 family)